MLPIVIKVDNKTMFSTICFPKTNRTEQGVFIMDEQTKLDAATENGEEASQLSEEDLEAAAGGCGPQYHIHHHYSGTQKPGTQKPGTKKPGTHTIFSNPRNK